MNVMTASYVRECDTAVHSRRDPVHEEARAAGPAAAAPAPAAELSLPLGDFGI